MGRDSYLHSAYVHSCNLTVPAFPMQLAMRWAGIKKDPNVEGQRIYNITFFLSSAMFLKWAALEGRKTDPRGHWCSPFLWHGAPPLNRALSSSKWLKLSDGYAQVSASRREKRKQRWVPTVLRLLPESDTYHFWSCIGKNLVIWSHLTAKILGNAVSSLEPRPQL